MSPRWLERGILWLPCARNWWNLLVFWEATSFLDHVYSGYTQRECKPNETFFFVTYGKKFDSRISAGATENLPGWEKHHVKTVAWSYDVEGHAKKRVWKKFRPGEQKDRTYKVSTPRLGNHSCKKEELESVGELSTLCSQLVELESVGEMSEVCSQIVLKCLYLARLGRPDIPWAGWKNKLVRVVKKWTRVCDKRFFLLISCIHHTNDYRHYCHVGNTASHCRLGLFQDSDFAGDREDSKSTSRRNLMYFRRSNIGSPQLNVQTINVSVSTVLQNQKLFRWMLVWAPCSGFMDVVTELWNPRIIRNHQPKGHQETACEIPTPRLRRKVTEILRNGQMWITLSQTQVLLNVKRSCVFSRTMMQWSEWSSNAEVRWWGTYPEPTELR